MIAVMNVSSGCVCSPIILSRRTSNVRKSAIPSYRDFTRSSTISSIFPSYLSKFLDTKKSVSRLSISKSPVVTRAQSSANDGLEVWPSQPILIATYLAAIAYTITVAPQGTSEQDAQLVLDLFTKGPFSPDVNGLFFAQFNALGVIPALYAAYLAPADDEDQVVPQLPFTIGSFFLGFFALGPYLILRKPKVAVAPLEEQGMLGKYFEAPVNKYIISGWAVVAAVLGVASVVTGGDNVVAEYVHLFQTNQLVNVSAIDCLILSTLVYGPFTEDMERRGRDSSMTAKLFFMIPLIGPALYYLDRPDLE
mmetsp:Transcript_12499/g.17038  ORF Transcript_12499/g.17038 Transcript_12499/m.17038 type:complete len:307 (-) Transcript_12499:29-949(-)